MLALISLHLNQIDKFCLSENEARRLQACLTMLAHRSIHSCNLDEMCYKY